MSVWDINIIWKVYFDFVSVGVIVGSCYVDIGDGEIINEVKIEVFCFIV